MAGVDDPVRPVDPAGRVESAQQFAPQALPHPGGRQSRTSRAAVRPEQPISLGTARHGTPVSSTKTIAVNAAGRRRAGRPVRRGDRSPRSQPPLAHCPPGATIPQRSVAIGRKRGPLSQSLWERARCDAGSTPPPWTTSERRDRRGAGFPIARAERASARPRWRRSRFVRASRGGDVAAAEDEASHGCGEREAAGAASSAPASSPRSRARPNADRGRRGTTTAAEAARGERGALDMHRPGARPLHADVAMASSASTPDSTTARPPDGLAEVVVAAALDHSR